MLRRKMGGGTRTAPLPFPLQLEGTTLSTAAYVVQPALARDRYSDIDRAKGLAIFLVVLGHVVAREPPLGAEWYMALKHAIYQFHMPLFMYLSGILFFLSVPAFGGFADYRDYVRRRAWRLLVPGIAVGVLIVAGKFAASRYLHVDNMPDGLWDAVRPLFWDTANSPALSIWYVFVLFAYCAAAPFLLAVVRGHIGLLLALALALYTFQFPAYFYLDRATDYLLFFLLGAVAAKYWNAWVTILDRNGAALMLAFAASFGLIAAGLPPAVTMLVIGLLSLPALHALARSDIFGNSLLFDVLGRYAFAIYLLNTICIGLAKGLALHYVSWDGNNFFLIAPLLLTAGLLGPILIKQWLLARLPSLDRMTN